MFILCILSLWSFVPGRAQTITYGDLMIEDSVERAWGKGRASLIGGYDVTNPYLNTYVYGFQVAADLTPSFSFEAENVRFNSARSRYNASLEDELKLFGVTADHDRPNSLSTIKGAVHVLAGRVNLFGLKAIPFRFDLRAGLGAIFLQDERMIAAGTWGFGPEIKITNHWLVSLAFNQDVQSVFARAKVLRNRLGLGVGYAWW